jgi:hypothetical protein
MHKALGSISFCGNRKRGKGREGEGERKKSQA